MKALEWTAAALLLALTAACAIGPGVHGTEVKRMARLNYVELPAARLPETKRFYESAFGWSMTDFGPDYAATTTGDTDVGLYGDVKEATKAPLPVIEVQDLEAALASVQKAGGTISKPIFAFPGGRRFHFVDPSGNELAAVRPD